jgi:hypothetical protein
MQRASMAMRRPLRFQWFPFLAVVLRQAAIIAVSLLSSQTLDLERLSAGQWRAFGE